MELKKNTEIYYYQIETWHQLDQYLDLSQQLKTNDLIFKILHEVYTINLNHMVILVSSTSICWRLFVNTSKLSNIYVSSGVIQSLPGPGHPGSQGRWLIIRICVIWLDLPLLVLNFTHSAIWTLCLTLKTTFWPTFTSVTCQSEERAWPGYLQCWWTILPFIA